MLDLYSHCMTVSLKHRASLAWRSVILGASATAVRPEYEWGIRVVLNCTSFVVTEVHRDTFQVRKSTDADCTKLSLRLYTARWSSFRCCSINCIWSSTWGRVRSPMISMAKHFENILPKRQMKWNAFGGREEVNRCFLCPCYSLFFGLLCRAGFPILRRSLGKQESIKNAYCDLLEDIPIET